MNEHNIEGDSVTPPQTLAIILLFAFKKRHSILTGTVMLGTQNRQEASVLE